MWRTRHRSKKKGDTLGGLKAYTVVHTLIKVADKALAYTKAHVFAQVKAKSLTDTHCAMEAEAVLDALADTLPESLGLEHFATD